jgi:hypothetical protein
LVTEGSSALAAASHPAPIPAFVPAGEPTENATRPTLTLAVGPSDAPVLRSLLVRLPLVGGN